MGFLTPLRSVLWIGAFVCVLGACGASTRAVAADNTNPSPGTEKEPLKSSAAEGVISVPLEISKMTEKAGPGQLLTLDDESDVHARDRRSAGRASEDAQIAMPLISRVDGARFLVAGRISVNRAERTVTIPAVVNQQHGLIEYILVHKSGKRHEALLTTDARPQDIHLACLLVGAQTVQYPVTLSDETPKTLVTVEWQRHGPAAHYAIEKLFLSVNADGDPVDSEKALSPHWIYQGSYFSADGFAAQQQGSIISLQTDAAALITGLHLPATDFVPLQQRIPAIGTPVSVVLTIPLNSQSSPKEAP